MDKFLKSRFFSRYSRLVDRNLAGRNLPLYRKKLNYVQLRCKKLKMDFNQNILVLHRDDLAREVFLHGFSSMDKYLTYDYMNIYALTEIWVGVRRDDEGNKYSHLDSLHDVLCITLNYDEAHNKNSEDLALQLVRYRVSHTPKGKVRYNWFFFRGDDGGLKNRYRHIRDMFYEDKTGMFSVYDLNTDSVVDGSNKNSSDSIISSPVSGESSVEKGLY